MADHTLEMRTASGIEQSTARRLTSVIRPSSVVVRKSRLFGLVNRRERWSLTWRGWLIVAFTVVATGAFLLEDVYPFLAITHRVDADVLVVEGWIHDYAIQGAVKEFKRGSYQRVFSTGGPVEGSGSYINDYHTNASIGADLLRKYGLPDESLQMVPSRVMDRDRTYGSAIALRTWFHEHNVPVHAINVLTEDVHARRTRLLFREALGHNISVGVIAVPNPDYDSKHWWDYSQGVKEVITETLGYFYAKFLFYPSRGVMSDVGGQRTESRAEDRGQRTEDRGERSRLPMRASDTNIM